MTPEEFKTLKRDKKWEHLRATFPEASKGHSRTRSAELDVIYEREMTRQSPTGRTPQEPEIARPPLRTEEGARARDTMVESAERAIATADYSPIELRLMSMNRRQEVMDLLGKMAPHEIQLVRKWKNVPLNRHTKRRRRRLSKQLKRRLSGTGVKLSELANLI